MRHQLLGQLQAILLQCYLEAGRRFPGQNVGIDDGEAHEKLTSDSSLKNSWAAYGPGNSNRLEIVVID